MDAPADEASSREAPRDGRTRNSDGAILPLPRLRPEAHSPPAAPAAEPQARPAQRRPQQQQQQQQANIDAGGAGALTGTGGGEAAGQAAPTLTAQQRLARRSETALVMWGLLNQLYAYAHTAHSMTPSQHLGQQCLAATRLGALLVAHSLPLPAWWRLRPWIITAVRLAIAWQLARTEGEQRGMALMLQRTAEPGAVGALKDGLRVMYGTRILSQCITILALGCPPLLVLLQQLCMQALLPHPAVLCAAPLLADPLTRSRMGNAWMVLDMLPLPHDGDAMDASMDRAGLGLLACMGVVRYGQIATAIMLPVIVSGYLASTQPQPEPQPEPRAQRAGERRQRGAAGGPAAAVCRIAAWAAAAWAWTDRRLADGCGLLLADPLNYVWGIWLLAGLAWMIAKEAAKAALRERA